jgi:hypothetical protein
MRESRTYGSGRGACDVTHVPTATEARVHHAARRERGCVGTRDEATALAAFHSKWANIAVIVKVDVQIYRLRR